MELMTNEIARALQDAHARDEAPPDSTPVVVKYFNPVGAQTWYITSGESLTDEETGWGPDWRLFGWCELGFGPGCDELGYVMLSELRSVKGPLGLGIERDLHYGQHSLAEVMH